MERWREATKAMFEARDEMKKLEDLLEGHEVVLERFRKHVEKGVMSSQLLEKAERAMEGYKRALEAAKKKFENAGADTHYEGGRRRSTRRKRKGTRRH